MNRVNMIITHRCNLRCKHCYMNADICNKEDSLKIFDLFKNTINKLKEIGINEIMITGGECSIFPYIIEMLEYCKNNDISVIMFTNGIDFNRDITKYVDKYYLSIDGLKNNHNKMRGNNKAFDRTINTIKYLIKEKKDITIQVTVTNDNIDEIVELSELLHEININKINLCCLLDDGRSIDNKLDSNINLSKVKEIVKKIYRNTGYNLSVHTNIFNKLDTKNYVNTKSISLPLWIDLVDNNYYLVKDNSYLSNDINKLSKENIDDLNTKACNYIIDRVKFINNDYYVLENEMGD